MKRIAHFKQTVREMIPAVAGARVDRVRQLGSCILLFALYGRGGPVLLAVSLERGKSGLHLFFGAVHKGYLRTSPLTDVLEKHLKGGRIGRVEAGEETVEMEVRRGGEYVFVFRHREETVELCEGGRALYVARRRGGELKLSFDGVIAPGAEHPGETSPGAQPSEEESADTPAPAAGFPPHGYPLNEAASRSLVEFVDERLRREMRKRIGKETVRIERLLAKLDAEKAETFEKEDLRRKGELMKTRLRELRKGMASATLEGPDGALVEVALDPALTPLENMNNLFKRYRKMKSRERYIDGNILRQREKLDALTGFARDLAERGLPNIGAPPGETIRLLDGERAGRELCEALGSPPGSRPAGARPSMPRGGGHGTRQGTGRGGEVPAAGDGRGGRRGRAFLRFASRTGKVIYAGRDAGENETLSTRVARGNDLWFHALGGAGSHVILRCDRKGEFSESDIADASLLALHFSKLRKRGEGEVVYTFCKYVRKQKNSREGTVSYHHNKTRYVKMDEGALRTLMGGESRALFC